MVAIAYNASAYALSGHRPSSLLVHGFKLTSTYTCTSVQYGPGPTTGTITFGVANKWYRHFLAPIAGDSDGTEAKPYEFLKAVEADLDPTYWTVSLTNTGYVQITYKSANSPTTGSLVWGAASPIAYLLGFANASGAAVDLTGLAPGSVTTAPYQPPCCLFAVSRDDTTGWQPYAAGMIASESRGGIVSAKHSGRRSVVQGFTLRVHPRTIAEKLTAGTTSHATAIYPPDQRITRRLQHSGPVGVAPPWSVDEFISLGAGRRLGLALGSFQAHVANTETLYDVGYLRKSTLQGGADALVRSDPRFKAYHDLKGFRLTQVEGSDTDGTESRA